MLARKGGKEGGLGMRSRRKERRRGALRKGGNDGKRKWGKEETARKETGEGENN